MKKMKLLKGYHIIMAIAIILSTSCEKESIINEKQEFEKISFTATTDEGETTKTQLGNKDEENKTAVNWISGDEVAVFGAGGYSIFTASPQSPATKATLTSNEAAKTSPTAAIYPAAMATSDSKKINFPSEQTYTANNVTSATMPMYAEMEGTYNTPVSFKNLCGILVLNLTGTGTKVSSIDITSSSYLHGEGSINTDVPSNPVLSFEGSNRGNTITLNVSPAVELDGTAKQFYIVVPPTESNTFTVTVKDNENVTAMAKIAPAHANNKFTRNKIITMGSLEYSADGLVYDYVNNKYEIYSSEGLWAFSDLVNGTGNTKSVPCAGGDKFDFAIPNPNIDAIMMKNLDLSSVCSASEGNWEPIGRKVNNEDRAFKGSFDGNDKTISNLYMDLDDRTYVGLFGFIDGSDDINDGLVKDLTLSNAYVKGTESNSAKINNVGAFASYMNGNGNIQNCKVTGDVIADGGLEAKAGGIVGSMREGADANNAITGCENKASVTALNGKDDTAAGGITGWAGTGWKIDDCKNSGTVKAENGPILFAGGITGYAQGGSDVVEITNSTNTASIMADDLGSGTAGSHEHSKAYVGGIVGKAETKVKLFNCKNEGPLTSDGEKHMGGIVGEIVGDSDIIYCSNVATITGNAANRGNDKAYIGGIAGVLATCEVLASYSSGNMAASSSGIWMGGIAGYIVNSQTNIVASYFTGAITSVELKLETYNYIGGIAGFAHGPNATRIYSCYTTTEDFTITNPNHYSTSFGAIIGKNEFGSTLDLKNNYYTSNFTGIGIGGVTDVAGQIDELTGISSLNSAVNTVSTGLNPGIVSWNDANYTECNYSFVAGTGINPPTLTNVKP